MRIPLLYCALIYTVINEVFKLIISGCKNCAPESKHAPPNRLLASLPPIDEDFSTICVLILWLSRLSPALQPASPAPIINTSTCCKIGAQGFFLNKLLHLTEQKRTSSQHLLHFFRHVEASIACHTGFSR